MAEKKRETNPAVKKLKAKAKRPDKANNQIEKKNTRLADDEMAFPVIGIGASASGLNALEALFKSMPSDTNMAFVIIAHLDPSHSTLLPEFLQHHTDMYVKLAEDETKVEPNNIYIIPPNKSMTIAQKTLYLFPKTEPYGSRLPIDTFMRSLAEDQGRNAVGIILSGAGADGTMGLRAIKDEGGLTMAQDPASAKYDSMPSSAIATGKVDHILPPEKMPQKLISYAQGNVHKESEGPAATDSEAIALKKIIALLRTHTGHDFSLYKQKTIWRRILRRMTVRKINDITDYANYMEGNRSEAKSLFKELLIGVTNFFRDPEAFEELKQKIIIPMMQEKPADYSFRIWVPGCATGEEVYSLAILFKESMETLNKQFAVQFFGTDIDEEAIESARSGVYQLSVASDVGAERMKQYFARANGAYKVKKNIHEMTVFAMQNLVKDPPFIKMDLISCRNLFIYMEQELQKRIIPIFHYSLKPGGALMLGYSESIGGTHELFEVVDKKWKIFKRVGKQTPTAGLELNPAMHIPREDRFPMRRVDHEESEKPNHYGI